MVHYSVSKECMRQSLVFLIIIILSFFYLASVYEDGSLASLSFFDQGQKTQIHLGNTPLRVDVLTTPEERTIGLSGRTSLSPTEGALFVFPNNGYHGIWMRNMQFPIDIIWVDENLQIVDIEKNVTPSTFPRIFEPRVPARFVIETNSNFTSSFDITVGEKVQLPTQLVPDSGSRD